MLRHIVGGRSAAPETGSADQSGDRFALPSLGCKRLAPAAATANIPGMSLPPSPQMPPAKPKISAEERRRRTANRLTMIRLKMAIGRELEERGITKPAELGAALGMPPAEATQLLARHHCREGDVALLEAAAGGAGVGASRHLGRLNGSAAGAGSSQGALWSSPCATQLTLLWRSAFGNHQPMNAIWKTLFLP